MRPAARSRRARAFSAALLGAACAAGCGTPAERPPAPAPAPAPADAAPQRLEGGPAFANPERLAARGLAIDWAVRMPQDAPFRSAHLIGAGIRRTSILLETEENRLISLQRDSGIKNWLVQLQDPIEFPPVQTHARLFCIGNDTLYSIDTRHFVSPLAEDRELLPQGRELGVLRWRVPLEFAAATAPASNDRFVAIGSHDRGSMYSVPIDRVDHAFAEIAAGRHGSLMETRITHIWQHNTRSRITAPPVVPDTHDAEQADVADLVIYATHEGRVYGRSLKYYENAIRSVAWEFPERGTIGAVMAPMTSHQGVVYVGAEDHTLYALRQESGYLQGKITLNGPIAGQPVVIGSDPETLRIYVLAEGDGLSCVRVDNATWIRRQRRAVINLPDEDGQLHPESIETPLPRWPLSVVWRIEGPERVLMEGAHRVYLYAPSDRTIWAVDKETGTVAWRERATGVDFLLTDTTDPEGFGTPETTGHIPPFLNRLFVVSRQGYVISIKEK